MLRQPIKKKENLEFKPVLPLLKFALCLILSVADG